MSVPNTGGAISVGEATLPVASALTLIAPNAVIVMSIASVSNMLTNFLLKFIQKILLDFS
jgi:hypothetical protein